MKLRGENGSKHKCYNVASSAVTTIPSHMSPRLQTGLEQRSPGESPMFVWTLKAAAGPKTLHGYISLLLGASAMANGAAIKDQ